MTRLLLDLAGFEGRVWTPNPVETKAAWELYVELATRGPATGADRYLRDELTQLHRLFPFTRDLLHRHGTALAKGGIDAVTFAHLATAMLAQIRPTLAVWHPRLSAYEGTRPVDERGTDRYRAAERAWAEATAARAALDEAWQHLDAYTAVFATACGTDPRLGQPVPHASGGLEP